jgi:hypothetical protein
MPTEGMFDVGEPEKNQKKALPKSQKDVPMTII